MVTIQKRTKRKGSRIQVTFAMPAIEGCGCLYLVGKFDEWNESVYRMQCADDGTWSLTLELEPRREYQYRFRTLDGEWLNDPTALPAPSPFRSENSVINTSAAYPRLIERSSVT